MTTGGRQMRIGGAAAVSVVLACGLAAPAVGQTGGDEAMVELRRENDQLRERVAELTAAVSARDETLRQMQATLEALRDEIVVLREMVRAGGGGASDVMPEMPARPASEPAFAELPTGTFGAPEAMLAYTVDSFQAAFGAAVPDFEASGDADTARRLHMQELKRWARRVNRQAVSPVEWTVEVIRLDALDRGGELQYRVVHPSSGLPYSDREFLGEVEGALYRSLTRMDRPVTEGVWVLRGKARIEPVIEPALTAPLAFDVPPFVGPFVEFRFDLDIDSLRRPPQEDDEETDA